MDSPPAAGLVRPMALFAVVALALVACTSSTESPTSTAPPDPVATTTTTVDAPPDDLPDGYFATLRAIQEQVRASPDHLSYEIERVAAAGDLDALLEFVRDHFTVIPPNHTTWVSNGTARWWGMEGALRSGQGTPREIAEVLAHAVETAGFPPRLVTTPDPATRPDLLAPRPLPPFAAQPPIIAEPITGADPLTVEYADRLGVRALESLPEPGTVPAFGAAPPRGMPTVVVEREGEQLIAGLWTDAGGWEPVGFVPDAGEAAPTPPVGVRVLLAMTDEPDNPIEVAAATVANADLVGRPLIVSFVPVASGVEELLALSPADVTAVVPTIRLAGIHHESELLTDAPAVTLDGRLLVDDESGVASPQSNFTGTGDPATVAAVEIRRINAGRYPWIEVDVEVSGSDGAPIADLAAAAFGLTEDGVVQPVMLERAAAPTPRVVFLLDDSASIPEQYRDEGAAEVIRRIATRVQGERPDAEFRVAFAGIEGASGLQWRTDVDALADDALGFSITGGLWEAYRDASIMDGNVVVFLTDGRSVTPDNQPQPEPPPDVVQDLLAAPPAIMLGAGDFGEAYFGLADLTGGVTLEVEDQEAAVDAVLGQMDALLTTYSIRYRATPDGAASRSVVASVGTARSESTYDVPPFDPLPVGPAGLYIELSTGGVRHTRTIAGVPFGDRRPATADDTEDVRRALFGTYTITAEPGIPTPAVLMDEAISAALQWEAVLEAAGSDRLEALTSIVPVLPVGATFSMPYTDPLDEMRTVDLGLRVWIGTERPALRDGRELLIRGVDLVPLNRVVTLAATDQESFATTLVRTARLSMLEALLFERSPTEFLAGAGLVPLQELESARRAEFAPLVAGWPGSTTFLVPGDGPAEAAIAIRPDGTTVAIGGTGQGVGITEEEVEARFDQIQSLLDLAGGLGGGPGAWAKLEKAKMEKLRFATIAIIRMDADGVADLIEEEVCDALSSAGDEIIGAGIRSAGLGGIAESLSEAVETINAVGGALGFDGEIPTGVDAC